MDVGKLASSENAPILEVGNVAAREDVIPAGSE
jgi:hypothetical protein